MPSKLYCTYVRLRTSLRRRHLSIAKTRGKYFRQQSISERAASVSKVNKPCSVHRKPGIQEEPRRSPASMVSPVVQGSRCPGSFVVLKARQKKIPGQYTPIHYIPRYNKVNRHVGRTCRSGWRLRRRIKGQSCLLMPDHHR